MELNTLIDIINKIIIEEAKTGNDWSKLRNANVFIDNTLLKLNLARVEYNKELNEIYIITESE